jgi:hypothetical protein
MKYIRLKLLSGVLLAGLLLTGCFDEVTKVYDGPAVVEFAQYHQPFAPATGNANYTSTVTFAAGTNEGSADLALRLQLIAPHFDTDAPIGFEVVAERLDEDGDVVDETTAVEGTHYTIGNANNQAVFPANSSETTINVEAIADNLDPGDSVRMILMLTETDMLEPAENYKYYTVVIRKAS